MTENARIKFTSGPGSGEIIDISDVKNIDIVPSTGIIRIYSKENDVFMIPNPELVLYIRTEEELENTTTKKKGK